MLPRLNPFEYFTDTNGDPLDGGYVYIGSVNQNPKTSPITVYFDSAMTIPAPQPLRTTAGRIIKSGAQSTIYTDEPEFSVLVENKYGQQLWYIPSNTGSASVAETVILSDFGAVGDGIADDSGAIAAFAAASKNKRGVIVEGTSGSIFNITTDIVFDNVLIDDSCGATFVGSGSVRGVLLNDAIPYTLFRVPFNLSLTKDRQPATPADLYVDPCLGVDGNDGASPTTPVKTLAGLRTRLNALIAIGSDTDITVVLRDGRHEIGSAVTLDTSQSTASVYIIANEGESPTVSSELLWFFRSGLSAANGSGASIYSLFDVEAGYKRAPITTTAKDSDRYWHRNTSQAVTLVGTTATIVPDAATYSLLSSATNLSKARLKVTQSWSGSMYHTLSLSGGSNLDYTIPSGQGVYYYNGFDAGVNSGYAPYVIEGLDSCKTAETWCNLGSTLMLPEKGGNVFVSPKAINAPFAVTANRYIIGPGISFCLHTPTATAMQDNYTGTPNSVATMVMVSGTDCAVTGCYLRDIEGSGVIFTGSGFSATNNVARYIGHTAIGGGNDATPESVTSATVTDNDIQYWGYHTNSGRAIAVAANNVNIKRNRCVNGTVQAIQSQASNTAVLSVTIEENIAANCGMPEGRKSDRYGSNDAGAIYVNGLGRPITLNVTRNVVYNVNGHLQNKGIYFDNGIEGYTAHQNLVFNVQGFALDARDVSSKTKNNTATNNIWFANVRMGDVSGGAYTNNIKIGTGGTQQDSFGSGVTITSPFSGKIMTGYTENDFAMIQSISDLTSAGGYAENKYPVSQYLTDCLGGVGEVWSTFNPLIEGTTTSGDGTYTRAIGRWYRQGNLVMIWLRCTWTAHTGTGNLRVNLNDLPYTPINYSGAIWPSTFWASNLGFSNIAASYTQSNSKIMDLTGINGAGANSSIPMDTSADIALTVWFPIS